MKLTFGDVVVVEGNLVGVVVKSWIHNNKYVKHEVYVRIYNQIREYKESEIERYLVRHKELNEDELMYQDNAVHPFIPESELNDFRAKLGIMSGEEWYLKKSIVLNEKYLNKYILDEDGDLVKIISVDVDHDPNNQKMNRVTDELGNKHFLNEIKELYTKEVS